MDCGQQCKYSEVAKPKPRTECNWKFIVIKSLLEKCEDEETQKHQISLKNKDISKNLEVK